MAKTTTYLLFALLISIMASCSGKKDPLPDLKESYSYRDTRPFGANIAYRIYEHSFSDYNKHIINAPFSKAIKEMYSSDALYFSVSQNLYTDANDENAILNFVAEGNTAFFSTSYIDSGFLSKINTKAGRSMSFSIIPSQNWRNTAVRLVKDLSFVKDSFHYFYSPFNNFFTETDPSVSRIVGFNDDSTSNCIVVFYGKGKLFLHLAPRAFSNYFLLTGNNFHYMLQLLQVMNAGVRNVYWDDYYNRLNYRYSDNSFSTLSEIMKYPPLAMAFWLLLGALGIYVLFGSKRRQKIIPVKKPNENSSVAFTETIGLLYLQKNDNKNIAEKMITYFNEYIRNNYFLHATHQSPSFIEALSRKSGVSLEKTTALYKAIHHANSNNTIDDFQLLSLSEQIQQFYKSRQ